MPALKAHNPSRKSRALPSSCSQHDLMYRLYVRQKIAAGLADIRVGRVHSHESVRREFGLGA